MECFKHILLVVIYQRYINIVFKLLRLLAIVFIGKWDLSAIKKIKKLRIHKEKETGTWTSMFLTFYTARGKLLNNCIANKSQYITKIIRKYLFVYVDYVYL